VRPLGIILQNINKTPKTKEPPKKVRLLWRFSGILSLSICPSRERVLKKRKG